MLGVSDPNQCWEVQIYALAPAGEEVPAELVLEDGREGRHHGRVGLVASANLAIHGDALSLLAPSSPLPAQIERRPALKTRVASVLAGWSGALLNAAGVFALERGLRVLRVPTAALATGHATPAAVLGPSFDVSEPCRFGAEREGGWWRVDLARHRDRLLLPAKREFSATRAKAICIIHDVERGWGHLDVDPVFARRAEREAPRALANMLRIEREAGILATYCVVGAFLPDVRNAIEGNGHCLAFHSYDHDTAKPPPGASPQLPRCRRIDGGLRGYRAPRSRLTAELEERSLCEYNFEWLASSVSSLGTETPELRRRVVRIPVHFDDFPLYREGRTWEEWEEDALARIRAQPFAAFGLHDCYGHLWLPHYAAFLARVRDLGTLTTLDRVATDLQLASGV